LKIKEEEYIVNNSILKRRETFDRFYDEINKSLDIKKE
jgi:hypothetical protein